MHTRSQTTAKIHVKLYWTARNTMTSVHTNVYTRTQTSAKILARLVEHNELNLYKTD